MYTVYVLHSPVHNKIHVGYTSDIENCLLSHNTLDTKGDTIKYRPWELFYFEEYTSEPEAVNREKELKSAKGREYIWEQIRNRPQLVRE